MIYDNQMTVSFLSKSQNEAFARAVTAAFVTQLDPTLSDISDIKTAVSEAVTNAVIHGYETKEGMIHLFCGYKENVVYIEIIDFGKGIENLEEARQPLFTSKPELERSGMGFTVMEMFMDEVEIETNPEKGTKIRMKKTIKKIPSASSDL